MAFAHRLGELGYVAGRNIVIEFRSAEGKPERFPELMKELARSNVDAILPVGPEASLRAAQKATTVIPIVVVAIDYDPIARGYVGGHATRSMFDRYNIVSPAQKQEAARRIAVASDAAAQRVASAAPTLVSLAPRLVPTQGTSRGQRARRGTVGRRLTLRKCWKHNGRRLAGCVLITQRSLAQIQPPQP